jgi:hypothetical protein
LPPNSSRSIQPNYQKNFQPGSENITIHPKGEFWFLNEKSLFFNGFKIFNRFFSQKNCYQLKKCRNSVATNHITGNNTVIKANLQGNNS